MKVKKSKHKHHMEQNVNMTRQNPTEAAAPTELSKRATQLKVLIEEGPNGDMTIEWVSVYKGTDIAIPMRYSHVIGKLQAASFILSKQFYGTQAPAAGQTPPQPQKG